MCGRHHDRGTILGEATFPIGDNAFALGAQSQTVLFMFLTSLTAATQLILTRQLGVSRRMLATPTPVRSILVGELIGRFAIALVQGLFIVLVSSFVFGVSGATWPVRQPSSSSSPSSARAPP